MQTGPSEPVTRLLLQWAGGDRSCLDQLMPVVDAELRRIAKRYMRLERSGHTLQTTALINEAYVQLVNETEVRAEHRGQFFALAAQIMRHILVDHARGAGRQKRGGGVRVLVLEEAIILSPERSADLIALDEALSRLAEVDPRKARVVEMRYFGGMEIEEVAGALQVHPNTVVRDWRLAKAWLKREVSASERDGVQQSAT
jgi:RNA polymerase sigma-70 factor (ECF subfamily)